MSNKKTRRAARIRRHLRLRKSLQGNGVRPRLSVFRSSRHIYAQLVDDAEGRTIVAASDVELELRDGERGTKIDLAKRVGVLMARRAAEAGHSAVVFDRGGFSYAGRVKALAEAAREEGLTF